MARTLDIARGVACALVILLAACVRAGVAEAQHDHEPISVEVHAAAWLRLELDSNEGASVSVPLFRPSITLRAADRRLRLYVRPELAEQTPRLLDAYVELAPSPALRVRAGRFKTPFSRLFLTSTTSLELPDRGIAVDRFRAGRALGVMASGRHRHRLHYYAGVFGAEDSSGATLPMVVGRLDVTAYGEAGDPTPSLTEAHPSGLAIGVNAYVRAGSESAMPVATAGLDAQLVEGPFSLVVEGFLERELTLGGGISGGGVAQLSMFVVPRWTEVVVRGSWVADAEAKSFEHTYELGLTAHLPLGDDTPGEHVKLTARYAFSANEMRHDALVQMQLAF